VIFTAPIPFAEAVASRKFKAAVGTTLDSQELQALGAAVRRRALVLARVNDAELVANFNRLANDILQGKKNRGAARSEIKRMARESGDHLSDARARLVLDTEVSMANGYGQWKQGQTRSILAMWPAQEFRRSFRRQEPRDWPARWAAAGGKFYTSNTLGAPSYPQGHMIAAKDDPIWRAINAFGNEWDPFDFNTGMRLHDVSRAEAVKLGVIQPDLVIQPRTIDFNEDVPIPGDLPETFQKALREALAA